MVNILVREKLGAIKWQAPELLDVTSLAKTWPDGREREGGINTKFHEQG
jgi:hypothetical protein